MNLNRGITVIMHHGYHDAETPTASHGERDAGGVALAITVLVKVPAKRGVKLNIPV